MSALRWGPLAVGALGLLGWAALALADLQAAAQGWLVALVFWSGPPLGALGVVLIHRLTGGSWGAAFAPELEPAARSTPILLLFALPLLATLAWVYPWAARPETLDPSVRTFWLNPPWFALRTVAALVGWAAIALRLPQIEGPRGRLGAGLALGFHAVAGSVLAADWVLSVQPQWVSSDYGMSFVIAQFAAALAWAGLQERRRAPEGPAGDLGALMFAAVLALTYLTFMGYIVVWYGDQPARNGWFLTRLHQGWGWLPAVAFGSGLLLATLLLASRRRLGAQRSVEAAGLAVLTGLLAYTVWLLAPAFGAASLAPAALAWIGMGGVWVFAAGGVPRAARQVEALAHGR